MTLAIQNRPKTLDEFVGNDDTVRALDTLLRRDRPRIPHAFLFTGDRGCGKTTLGRITAEMLGCPVDSRDFKEFDSAQFNGVDTIREIRQNMAFSPMEGPCIVYLLDECHRLTGPAQDGLLKALEEAPAHVYFILCTTDPDKLLVTVRSRCKAAHFQVSRLEEDVMIPFLRRTASGERKRIAPEILEKIAERSEGSCRDALGMLDKIIDLDPEDMNAMIESEGAKEVAVIEFCRAMLGRQPWKKVADMLKVLLENNDPEELRRAVMGYSSKVLLGQDSPSAFILLDCFREPTYTNGKAGLIMAAYEALEAVKDSKD